MNWRNNTELLETVTTNALPEPWKSRVLNEQIELEEIPEKIRFEAMTEGTKDYVASQADYVHDYLGHLHRRGF